ncbi:MAG: hypothetical protein JNK57_14065 [Planctomycetaceae bacterium]|jgi:hypothetical protein|nr:hypothetical protein [Planctomycetaceae bacterium]
MNTEAQNGTKTERIKRIACGWSFETIDPQHSDANKRAAVRCPTCKTYYIKSVIAGKRCVNGCDVVELAPVNLEGRVVQPLEVSPRIPITGKPGPFYTVHDRPLGSNLEPIDFGAGGMRSFVVRNNSSQTWRLTGTDNPNWVSLQPVNQESLLSGLELAPGAEQHFRVRAHFLQPSGCHGYGHLRFQAISRGQGSEKRTSGEDEAVFVLNCKSGEVAWRFPAILWPALVVGLYFSVAIGFVLCTEPESKWSSVLLSVPGVSVWLSLALTLLYAASPELIRQPIVGLFPEASEAVSKANVDKVWKQGMFPPESYYLNLGIGFLSALLLMLALGVGRWLTYLLGLQGSFLAGALVSLGFAVAWLYGLHMWLGCYSFNVLQYLVAVFSRR